MKTRNIWIVMIFLFGISCENLEDTYSDYAGDGMIRYLGKCSNVNLKPGWERLELNWTNSVDPVIDKIKITWKTGEIIKDSLLDKHSTSCNIRNLLDGNYEVTICNIDKEGRQSLLTKVYGRPFTENHETIKTFTKGLTKYFKVNNNLVLFFDDWNNNIVSLSLDYFDVEGKTQTMELTKELVDQKYFILENIDTEKPVTINREGRVEACPDLIAFAPYALSYDRAFSTDFKLLLEVNYGLKEVDDDFVNNLKELEIDYSINSFEDILYFPNLEKIILGKNRYLHPDYLENHASASIVYESDKSIFALNAANSLYGLKIERYNQHFFPTNSLDYIEDKENPVVPNLSYLDATDWTIDNSVEDPEDYDSYVENLLDNNPSTFWETKIESASRLYELNIDMKQMQSIGGFKIVQKTFNPISDRISPFLLPGMIRIKVSTDRIYWENASYVEDRTIGNTNGEITILKMQNPKEVRYIKMFISDQIYGQDFGVALADIAIFN